MNPPQKAAGREPCRLKGINVNSSILPGWPEGPQPEGNFAKFAKTPSGPDATVFTRIEGVPGGASHD